MKTKELIVNLARFESFAGKLIPDTPVELRLIELYRMIQTEDNSPIEIFTKEFLNYLFKDTIEHKYGEISIFYKEKRYVHIIQTFLHKLEIYLLHHCPPNIHDIVFKEYRDVNGTRMAVFTIHKE